MEPDAKLTDILTPHLDRIRGKLADFAGSCPSGIRQIIHPLFTGHGKLLRPTLVILASGSGKGPDDRTIELAAIIEIFHIATLIHDDIIDDAGQRRGLRTVHSSWGAKKAVLAGDYLLAKALEKAAAFGNQDQLRQAAAGISRICRSEIDQSLNRFRYDCSLRSYMRRISGKTAALFAAAAHAGATESGCDTQTTDKLRRFGYNLGMCFQIIDDVLDFQPSTGKKMYADLKNGIIGLPLLLALQERPDLRRQLPRSGTIFRQASARKAGLFICRKTGAINKCLDFINLYETRALREIGALGKPEQEALLKDFFLSLLRRKK